MSISREVLAKYITPGCNFIETGARWGDTLLKAAEAGAGSVASCEVDTVQCAMAKAHVRDARLKVPWRISEMESSAWLTVAGVGLENSVVFLDAHTDTHSPILEELASIKTWKAPPKTILIDDLRLMEGWRIGHGSIFSAVQKIAAYDMTYEDGIEPKDILVCQLREK